MTKLKRVVTCLVIQIFIIMGTSDVIARWRECEAAGRVASWIKVQDNYFKLMIVFTRVDYSLVA